MDPHLLGSYQPFVVAGLILIGLVAIEVVSLIAGFSLSHFIEKNLEPAAFDKFHAEVGGASVLGGLMGWLNAGRVPFLVLLIIGLAGFSGAGFILQTLAMNLFAPLPLPVASLIAIVLAALATRTTTRLVSAIVPREETYAVSNDDLVGRVGEVTVGPLDQGPAGRVKVQDAYGNWHFPLAKAAEGHGSIHVGAQVLLVDRRDATFLVIPAPEELKTSS